MEIKTAKELAQTIFECGLAPHSDITEEWIEEKIIALIKMHCQAQEEIIKNLLSEFHEDYNRKYDCGNYAIFELGKVEGMVELLNRIKKYPLDKIK
jgi:hypothetical protein